MKYVSILIAIAIAFCAGAIGSLFTSTSLSPWYEELVKSPLNPPGFVFGPVWTVLYICIGYASYLIWKKRHEGTAVALALGLYVFQLALNALWSIVFFGLQMPEIAFIILLFLFVSIVVVGIIFYRIRKLAGLLFVPYVFWVAFAGYLNLFIVLNN
jgi:benzodiazapine receptor